MLLDANLSKYYWAEAVSTAVYLKNRSPTKAVQGMTPFEAWHGKKPSVDNLRVFGCDAYAHIPKEERGKCDKKARKCVLLGYGAETKGYRLYEVKDRKIVYSRDVQFNENSKYLEQDPHNSNDYKLIVNFPSNSVTPTDDDCEDQPPNHAEPHNHREDPPDQGRSPTIMQNSRVT